MSLEVIISFYVLFVFEHLTTLLSDVINESFLKSNNCCVSSISSLKSVTSLTIFVSNNTIFLNQFSTNSVVYFLEYHLSLTFGSVAAEITAS